MASYLKDLSSYNPNEVPSATDMHFGIVVSEWNDEVTNALLEGAYSTLINHGAQEKNIIIKYVPGSFELPVGAQLLLGNEEIDSVICLGCVIQGETRHFEFISNAVANGIMNVSLEFDTPVIFGLLTTDNLQQAKDRSGGKHGNKGIEAAITAIKMTTLKKSLNLYD